MSFFRKKFILVLMLSLTACTTNNKSKVITEETKNKIYIYHGPGVSSESLEHTQYSLTSLTKDFYIVKLIGPREVSLGGWRKDAKLFVMPGGADLPYCEHLHPIGNKQINGFIKDDGGAYLGFCAGAYYGSQKIEFAKGTTLEVLGTRDLNFFKGVSIGPVLAPYDYESNSGARMARLHLNDDLKVDDRNSSLQCFYNGGGYFLDAQKYPNTKVLAYYIESNNRKDKPAVIEIKVGKGRVILSGPHCEYAPELLDEKDIYLTNFIPKLKDSNAYRIKFLFSLLKRLGVNI